MYVRGWNIFFTYDRVDSLSRNKLYSPLFRAVTNMFEVPVYGLYIRY